MGFINAQERRAYQHGYQVGYRLFPEQDWKAERRRLRREHAAHEFLETMLRGFTAGVSNRQGDAIARRKADWYQKERPRIVKKQRIQRRRARAELAASIALHIQPPKA